MPSFSFLMSPLRSLRVIAVELGAFKGLTPVVKTTGSRHRLNLISVVSSEGIMRYKTFTGSMDRFASVGGTAKKQAPGDQFQSCTRMPSGVSCAVASVRRLPVAEAG